MLVSIQQNIWCNIPEDHILDTVVRTLKASQCNAEPRYVSNKQKLYFDKKETTYLVFQQAIVRLNNFTEKYKFLANNSIPPDESLCVTEEK
jgi:hypothetical protein